MVQPTNRVLLLPGKNALGSDYKKDTQILEAWARQPIQQLVAGSGVTLSPASGLATDANGRGPNPVTISAAGGGGQPNAFLSFQTGPEASLAPSMPVLAQGYVASLRNNWLVPLWDASSSYVVSVGTSWLYTQWNGVPNTSVNILPRLNTTAIPYTGGGVSVQVAWGACSIDGTGGVGANQLSYSASAISVPSGTVYQMLTTDFSNVVSTGTDLSLHAGTGLSGNGILTASGGISYLCSVTIAITVLSGTTF